MVRRQVAAEMERTQLHAEIAELQQWFTDVFAQQEQAEADAQRQEQANEWAGEILGQLEDFGLTAAEQQLVAGQIVGQVNAGLELDIDGAIEAVRAAPVERAQVESMERPDPVFSDSQEGHRRDIVEWSARKHQADERTQRDLARAEGNDDRPWVAEGREPHMHADPENGVSELRANQERWQAMGERLTELNEQSAA